MVDGVGPDQEAVDPPQLLSGQRVVGRTGLLVEG